MKRFSFAKLSKQGSAADESVAAEESTADAVDSKIDISELDVIEPDAAVALVDSFTARWNALEQDARLDPTANDVDADAGAEGLADDADKAPGDDTPGDEAPSGDAVPESDEAPSAHRHVILDSLQAIEAEEAKHAAAAHPLRRTVTKLDKKSGGRLRAHKWAIAMLIGVLAIVAIGLPLGFAAGWGIGTGIIPVGEQEEPPAPNPNLELRNKNVEEHYKALGIDEEEFDRVSGDDIEPITVDSVEVAPTGELDRLAHVDVSEGTSSKLDVPLVNQLDDADGGRSLRAGCEVASLSMLLAYSDVEASKEELQDAMPTVPIVDEDGKHGNPNLAFVGDMGGDEHGDGYSVYHAPVAALAQRNLLNQPYYVVDLTGQSFSTILKELADGNPCWVITTTTMQPDQKLETWDTSEGEVVVNWALHSVVLTGFDDDSVFINDPYGYDTNVAYDRKGFEEAWKLMGSQAVTIVPASSVKHTDK